MVELTIVLVMAMFTQITIMASYDLVRKHARIHLLWHIMVYGLYSHLMGPENTPHLIYTKVRHYLYKYTRCNY